MQAPVGRAYFSRITTDITAMFALALRYKIFKISGRVFKMHKKTKKLLASVMAMATLVPSAVATITPMTASAGLVVGESTFDHKALPWHTCESSPARPLYLLTL